MLFLSCQTVLTVRKVVQVPNVVVQLTRQEEWAQQHTDVLGPRSAFLYFGPSNSPGQVAYGNGGRVPMSYYLRKKKEGSKYDVSAVPMLCGVADSVTQLAIF